MDHTLINLVLALATNEIFHNFIETKSARDKIVRLQAYISKKPYKEMKLKIDTRAKSYGISAVAFIAGVGIFWAIYSALNIAESTALKLIIGIMILSFVVLAVFMDKYHVDIERVTKQFKHKA